MDWFLQQIAPHFGHFVGIFALFVLLLSGLGLPVPEDVPLLVIGYTCYATYGEPQSISIWIMLPLAFFAVVGADSILYYIGRRYGHHVPKLPLLKKYLTEARLAKAEQAYHNHGGKTLFFGRFLPGLRAPVFLTAGVFRIPYWKMVMFDGMAAMISVPAWVLASYFFGEHIDRIKKLMHDAKLAVALVVLGLILVFVIWKMIRRRRPVVTPYTPPTKQVISDRANTARL